MNRVVIDTETAGTLEQPLTYDIGWQVIGKDFQPIISRRFIVAEIWSQDNLLQSAYYADKLPAYRSAIANGSLQVVSLASIRKQFAADCKQYHVSQVWAYNATFDKKALNNTCETVSNGLLSWFLPYGVKWHCIHALACSTFLNRPTFFKFASENGFVSPAGNVRTDAQTAYAYLNTDPTYCESHTALQDVIIERQLLAYGMTRHTAHKVTRPTRNAWQLPQGNFKAWRKRH